MITVLDNFHFDLSAVSACEGSGQDEGDCGNGEEEDATEGNDTDTKEAVPQEEESEGLEEREKKGTNERSKALAMKIYKNIVKTILPNLQQVLTKKVFATHVYMVAMTLLPSIILHRLTLQAIS